MALYFVISVWTVYRPLGEGNLRSTKIRGCLRVAAEALKRFEESLVIYDMACKGCLLDILGVCNMRYSLLKYGYRLPIFA